MKTTLTQLLQSLPIPQPSAGLAERILMAVFREEARRARKLKQFALAGIFVSGALLGVVVHFWGQAIVQSEFWQMITLVVSDFAVVARYWDSLLLALLETFPALPLTLFFAPLFSLLLFFSMYASVSTRAREGHSSLVYA